MNKERTIPGTRKIVYQGIGLYILIGLVTLVVGWMIPYPGEVEGRVLRMERNYAVVGVPSADLIKLSVGDRVRVADDRNREGIVVGMDSGMVRIAGGIRDSGMVRLEVLTKHHYFQTLFFKKMP